MQTDALNLHIISIPVSSHGENSPKSYDSVHQWTVRPQTTKRQIQMKANLKDEGRIKTSQEDCM